MEESKIVSGYGGIENCIWLWRSRKLYLAMEEAKVVSGYGGIERILITQICLQS